MGAMVGTATITKGRAPATTVAGVTMVEEAVATVETTTSIAQLEGAMNGAMENLPAAAMAVPVSALMVVVVPVTTPAKGAPAMAVPLVARPAVAVAAVVVAGATMAPVVAVPEGM